MTRALNPSMGFLKRSSMFSLLTWWVLISLELLEHCTMGILFSHVAKALCRNVLSPFPTLAISMLHIAFGWLPRRHSGTESTYQCKRYRRCEFDPQVRKIPLEEEMATQFSILVRIIPWTEEPGRLWSIGHKESNRTEHTHIAYVIIHRIKLISYPLSSLLSWENHLSFLWLCKLKPDLSHPINYSSLHASISGKSHYKSGIKQIKPSSTWWLKDWEKQGSESEEGF